MRALIISRVVEPWRVVSAIKIGLEKIGFSYIDQMPVGVVQRQHLFPYHLIITVGWKPEAEFIRLYNELQIIEKKFIAISDGYMQRSADAEPKYSNGYWAVSYNGLNSYTENAFHDCPSNRWEQLNIELQPWKKEGKTILIAHQHRQDWLGGRRTNAFGMMLSLAKLSELPIKIRLHPNHWRNCDFPEFTGHTFTLVHGRRHTAPIEDDLQDAYCLLTYDSNAAVDAIIAGVPAFTVGRTIADKCIKKDFDLNKPLYYNNRERWAAWAAYQQWTIEEIAAGTPFQYLLGRNVIL